MDATDAGAAPPLRFTLMGVDQVRQAAAGPPERVQPRLLPAELEKVLTPFEVTRAFTLRGGLREYLAVRRA